MAAAVAIFFMINPSFVLFSITRSQGLNRGRVPDLSITNRSSAIQGSQRAVPPRGIPKATSWVQWHPQGFPTRCFPAR